jgi:AraC family transcriptional regulator of arabinose operon
MNMDETIEVQQRLAMAKVLYGALNGAEADPKTLSLSASYSRNLFVSPWRDSSDSGTQEYARRFFGALHEMGTATGMAERWRRHFDADNSPRDPVQARLFISEFFRLHLHYPRDYHNFVCQRRDITEDGVLDFPIEHPISVEFWAIYITVTGSATLTVEGESTKLGPNSIAIIAPGCNCTLSRSEGAEHWSYHWLSFRSRLDWIELLAWATELHKPVIFQLGESDCFDFLTQQSERLESTIYQPGTMSERLCNNMIENMLMSLHIFAEDLSGGSTPPNKKLQGAVDYILKYYGEEISLGMIAESVGSSPVRLSTLFREHFGISVIRWRDQLRMQKAKELIVHSQDSISSIADRVGYPDPLYFSRRFKTHFGVAPSALRTDRGG